VILIPRSASGGRHQGAGVLRRPRGGGSGRHWSGALAVERAASYRETMTAWRAATAEQWGLERADVAGVLLFAVAGLAVPMT